MAYNNNKGPQHSGDIQFEGDPDETQIDFENDSIALKTGGSARVVVNNTGLSGSGVLQSVGATILGSSLTVSGNVSAGNDALGTIVDFNCAENTNAFRVRGAGDEIVRIDTDASNGHTFFRGKTRIGSHTAAPTAEVSVTGDVSGSGTLQAVGTTTLGNTLNVSGTIFAAGAVSASSLYGDGTFLQGITGSGGTMSSFILSGNTGTTQTIINGNTLFVSGGTGLTANVAATDKVSLALDNTSVSAGSYTYTSLTVDAQGRLTAASNGTAPALTSITNQSANRVITSDGTGLANAEANLTFDGTKLDVTGHITASLGISGSYFMGDGSGLTGLPLPAIANYNTSGDNRIITSVDADTVQGEANLTFNGTTLSVTGDISGSNGGVHITGSDPHIAIGARRGSSTNEIMLNVSPGEGSGEAMNNKILALFKRQGDGGRTVLAVTGSGKVAVGGANLAGVFNVSGSDAETLIHAKGDSIAESFKVDALGNTNIAGTLSVTQAITSSLGIHVTGSSPKLSIGTKGGHSNQDGMLFVRPTDEAGNNNVLALFQGASGDGQRIVFAASGSGQVLIGGGHIAGGILSVSGSTAETLITAKSDSLTNAFQVAGNGNTTISGSLRAKSLHMTSHKFAPGGSTAHFVRFDTNGSDSVQNDNNKLVAPFSGKLIKVVARATSAPGSTVIGLHSNVDGAQNVSSTSTEDITVNMASANTTYTFNFTDTANYGPGDIVGVKFNPTSNPGTVTLTSVWEFDQNS